VTVPPHKLAIDRKTARARGRPDRLSKNEIVGPLPEQESESSAFGATAVRRDAGAAVLPPIAEWAHVHARPEEPFDAGDRR
jgi:hypothetical protein